MSNVQHSASDTAHTAHAAEAADAHRRYTNPVLVFAVLTVSTIIEVAISLLRLPKSSVVPVLVAMSLVKASLIALYYMHLRYERWIYTAIFITPAIFAVFLILVLLS